MGTASTMACIAEALGMSLPGTAAIPAVHADRLVAAEMTGKAAVDLVARPIRPSQVITEKSVENAFRVLMAIGGSTNAIVHLTAVAGRLGIRISTKRFNEISDETPVLVDLYERYHKDGLEIVTLSYEYTDDAARNARQIEIFRKKYGIEYPILMAGTTAEGEIARTLPQLVGFGAYPTTIFVGRDGRVRKIHAGFSGPATGERFAEVKREFDELVRQLLAEK
jgi:hypothetical protein